MTFRVGYHRCFASPLGRQGLAGTAGKLGPRLWGTDVWTERGRDPALNHNHHLPDRPVQQMDDHAARAPLPGHTTRKFIHQARAQFASSGSTDSKALRASVDSLAPSFGMRPPISCYIRAPCIENTEERWSDLIELHGVKAIIISPGPGSPERFADFGICRDVILGASCPPLGVCLGHQGLGYAYGVRVVPAPTPMHGRVSRITHDRSALFEGIPPSFDAVRYHSLCPQKDSIPPCLTLAASSADGVAMAVRHPDRPRFGVQFHPEALSAECGERLVRNFLRIASPTGRNTSEVNRPRSYRKAYPPRPPRPSHHEFKVVSRSLDAWIEPQSAFEHLFERSKHSFWIDGSGLIPGYARFSVVGNATGPDASILLYRTSDRTLETRRQDECRRKRIESLLPELRKRLARPVQCDDSLPSHFQTGLVGYFGYKMRNELGSPTPRASSLPDAALFDTDRCIVFDHADRRVYLVARIATSHGAAVALRWFDRVALALADAQPGNYRPNHSGPPIVAHLADGPNRYAQNRYAQKISRCQHELAAGESYQICLSSEFSVECDVSPYDAYRQVRAVNPAPYAAYLRFGGFAVLSSSPERFLHVSADRTISAKPIKGTCARGGDPETDSRLALWLRTDENCRSDNLMIVDLLRNDIGRVASTGSVQVPKLMDAESYATVHQLVSTVTDHLRQDRDCLDCLAAAFPGDSMTGAPKLRTMSIIDRSEERARGPYSGRSGFLLTAIAWI